MQKKIKSSELLSFLIVEIGGKKKTKQGWNRSALFPFQSEDGKKWKMYFFRKFEFDIAITGQRRH